MSVYSIVLQVFHINFLSAAPVEDCNALLRAVGAFFVIAAPSTSALFLFRVKAVYLNNKIITTFFTVLLFVLFGLTILVPLSIKGAHIGPTKRCVSTRVPSYTSAPIVVNTVFDTLVFFAISIRIASRFVVGNTFVARLKSFFVGNGFPNLSKSILQGGQLYYSFVVVLSGYRQPLTVNLQRGDCHEHRIALHAFYTRTCRLSRHVDCTQHCAGECNGLSSLQRCQIGCDQWGQHCERHYSRFQPSIPSGGASPCERVCARRARPQKLPRRPHCNPN
jgi:hypothetical protein